MTKSEIRSSVISKLDIGRNDICWDIGCGTGSVSVEMALQCYDGAVYAVDKNDEAVKLSAENAFRFGCDNIKIISGEATQVISDFPAPDRVFIGGSCGKIKEIMNAVYDKNICAEIVITAVSLETLNEAVEAFSHFKVYNPEIVQIAVTRTRKLGNHTMLSAENPIFIIKGVRN
jgi:precorrin-6Y C5,15-methyltransferase (decarboxylating)